MDLHSHRTFSPIFGIATVLLCDCFLWIPSHSFLSQVWWCILVVSRLAWSPHETAVLIDGIGVLKGRFACEPVSSCLENDGSCICDAGCLPLLRRFGIVCNIGVPWYANLVSAWLGIILYSIPNLSTNLEALLEKIHIVSSLFGWCQTLAVLFHRSTELPFHLLYNIERR